MKTSANDSARTGLRRERDLPGSIEAFLFAPKFSADAGVSPIVSAIRAPKKLPIRWPRRHPRWNCRLQSHAGK